MRRDIDVTEVEKRTKIRAKYIRALENEEFASLPGPTYVRSFLRTYADFLGLDGGLLVEEYRAHHEPPDEADLQFGGPPSPRARERGTGGPGRAPRIGPPGPGAVIGIVAAVIVAILLVVGLAGDDGGSDGGGDDAADTETVEKRDSARRRAARRRAAARERARKRAAARSRRVQVRIVPADATYVCVDDGQGEVVFEGTLSQPQTFRGRRVRVNLGKRSAELRRDGRRVRFDESPEPIGFDFRAGERSEELPLEERPCA